MRLDHRFRTDPAAEIDGVWIPIGEGAALKIARAGNPQHRAVLDELRQPFRALVLAGIEPPAAEIDRISIEAMARTILLDWRGIEDTEGQPQPYDRDSAVAALTELPDFRDLVSALATDVATFRAQGLEAARKKLIGALDWHLRWGPECDFLILLARADGHVPEALARRIDPHPWLEQPWSAFWRLRRRVPADRPIDIASLSVLLDELGISHIETRGDWAWLIERLDDAWLAFTPGKGD